MSSPKNKGQFFQVLSFPKFPYFAKVYELRNHQIIPIFQKYRVGTAYFEVPNRARNNVNTQDRPHPPLNHDSDQNCQDRRRVRQCAQCKHPCIWCHVCLIVEEQVSKGESGDKKSGSAALYLILVFSDNVHIHLKEILRNSKEEKLPCMLI